ncbi:hypothetical protein BA895_08195 [Humibacillus sp. DSM 29435]|uniref:hypothetical protein n=1 Tax=Humibacillus sp. DSM 29435 TaxID=1869167 RepID=UPI000872B065|nr:hypothetical protein [Humibacillus sp. DSM 29435]OFE15094.1 hypothetical protein BA895_08195 [Humibacillus sp. DSM 29435]
MSAQDDLVNDSLDILQQMQIGGMDYEDYVRWQSKINDVKHRYDDARAVEKDEKRSADERKAAKDTADAIAKAAPAITKSVIAAVKAFSKGDAVTGAAELMDICASLAPLISTFLAAAGPEGMLIGALFSVIGQILRCFGPKEESDVSKLETFLKGLAAQTQLQNIKSVHDDVLTYATTLTLQAKALRAILARPLNTHEDYKAFYVKLGASTIVVSDIGPHKSVSMFEQWKVLEYLQAPENHNDPLWPAVLGVCCKTYSDLVSTTMTITAMTNSDDLLARFDDVAPGSSSSLSAGDKDTLERKLMDLVAYAEARMKEYQSCNARMLRALKGLASVAQQWGVYACIADNYALKFLTGPQNVKSGSWTDRSDRNYYHRLVLVPDAASTITNGQVSSEFNFKPAYHCFVLKSSSSDYPGSSHWVDHSWAHHDDVSLDHGRNILDNFNPALTDLCVADETDKGLNLFAGTAEGTGAPGSVMAWTLKPTDGYNTGELERVNWWPQTTSPVDSIAAVNGPVALLDDPDSAAIPPGWGDAMIYASMHGSAQIYLNTGNHDYYLPMVPGWGPCTRVAVDQSYLWVYQPYGFALVSHASVRSYIVGTRAAPRWIAFPSLGDAVLGEHLSMGDGAQDVYYNGNHVETKPPLLGLVSLSPCEDGTLLAAVVHRTITHDTASFPYNWYRVRDTRTIQTAPYEIDGAAGTVKVGPWAPIPGEARQVQKLPMPGWKLLANLTADLSRGSKPQ